MRAGIVSELPKACTTPPVKAIGQPGFVMPPFLLSCGYSSNFTFLPFTPPGISNFSGLTGASYLPLGMPGIFPQYNGYSYICTGTIWPPSFYNSLLSTPAIGYNSGAVPGYSIGNPGMSAMAPDVYRALMDAMWR